MSPRDNDTSNCALVTVIVHLVICWMHSGTGSGDDLPDTVLTTKPPPNIVFTKQNARANLNTIEERNKIIHSEDADAKQEAALTSKSPSDNLKVVEERNKMRLQIVEQVCNAKVKTRAHEPRMRVIMDPSHKIAYCRVNKVASTYTLQLLTSLFKCSEDCLRNSAAEITSLPYPQMRQAVSKSFKFTFVREPYGRLFSTYSNKFYFPKENWAPIGPRVVKRYRNSPSKDSLKYGHDLTFTEMIRFTVEMYEAGHALDEHLRPMHEHCYPCDYQYDFIGKLETMESDWAYLKDVWSSHNKIKEVQEMLPIKYHPTALKHIPRTLDLIRNSTISRYKLYLRAWTYYQMLGSVNKHIIMPFPENTHIRYLDFEHALEVAIEKSEPYAEETKLQKFEAMKQAYASVPMPLLVKLKRVVALDCRLYGYEIQPEWVFNRYRGRRTDFNYFKGLD